MGLIHLPGEAVECGMTNLLSVILLIIKKFQEKVCMGASEFCQARTC